MIDYEFVLRAAAVVAAAALVAGPSLVATGRQVLSWQWKLPSRGQDSAKDSHTVLEIARRLQAAGNARGVELCQQLLDVLLQPEKKR